MKSLGIMLKDVAKFLGMGLGLGAIVGIIAAVVLKWPIIQGVYVVCFILGAFAMLYAGIMFIGTPQMRYDYLVRGKVLRRQGKADEVEDMELYGLLPACLGVGFVVIGFILEALTH